MGAGPPTHEEVLEDLAGDVETGLAAPSQGQMRPPEAASREEKGRVMDRQDVSRELGQPGARELLESATVARLAYNGPDGLPRVIPIAFYWDGERIVVCTATTSPKVQALSARPEVAITIDVGDTPAAAKSLLVRGFANLETVDGVADEYLAGAKKAMDPETHAAFEGHVRSMYEQQVRISIEPQWARFYDFGAGRLPAFLTQLAAST
jgi:nitroimidazol reductase NimA-like FMN-containing flavoprotein (pyridoxamine 5'-phosphate oxidase superfamily)